MKQTTLIHQNKSRLNVSFQQKSAGLSLLIISSATIYYVMNMWPMRPVALASDVLPAGFGSLVLTAVAFIIIAQIVLQSGLAVGSKATSAATPHEKAAALKARRNAYGVLTFGLFAAIGSVFLEELTPFCTANLAILGLCAAEITKFSSQLIYGRQSSPLKGEAPII